MPLLENSRREGTDEHYQVLFDDSPDAIFVESLDGVVLNANKAAALLHGISREKLIGRRVEELVPEAMRTQVREHFPEWSTGAMNTVESWSLTADGRIIPVEIRGQRTFYNGEPALLLHARDISARKREQEELQRSEKHRTDIERKMLDSQKLESLGVLAGGIAHDFNNLLTAMLGNAALVRTELPGDAVQQEYLREIEHTALQAADLCKQLLAYSGQARSESKPTDLNTLVKETRQLLQVSVSKKVVLHFNLEEGIPLVEADSTQLRQVLMNLVINASEAIGDREGEVVINSRRTLLTRAALDEKLFGIEQPEGEYACIEVRDNGCGMSRETREKIFDPFFTTKFTGRGLGLAAVLGIVRGHRGMLEIESEEGKGTSFSICLPVTHRPAPAPTEDAESHEAEWQWHGTALLVDDEQSVRMIGERLLESFGCKVLLANDGQDGVDAFLSQGEKIELVILDVTMPRLSGPQAFRLIRKHSPDVPVLFISGYANAMESIVLDAHTDFLAKPFRLEELRKRLKKLLAVR